MAPAVALVTLSPLQVIAVLVMTSAAIALSYLLGLDEGGERTKRELFKQARENGVDPRWLTPLQGDDGE